MISAKEFSQKIDHTLLKTGATDQDFISLFQQANQYLFKAVCLPPSFLRLAKKQLCEEVRLCTVIGFPLGYQLSQTKFSECQQVLQLGAQEVDMVININWLKAGHQNSLKEEISTLAKISHDAGALLKVIIETSELSLEEKKTICQICHQAQVDFVKTSTGFSSQGAKLEDVRLMRSWLPRSIKIKASGGIRTLDNALAFIDAGADRLGVSSGVQLIEELKRN